MERGRLEREHGLLSSSSGWGSGAKGAMWGGTLELERPPLRSHARPVLRNPLGTCKTWGYLKARVRRSLGSSLLCRFTKCCEARDICESGPAREADRPDRRDGPEGAVYPKTWRSVQDVLKLGQDSAALTRRFPKDCEARVLPAPLSQNPTSSPQARVPGCIPDP